MKKELNNKGFTLVELLATVVILLAISTIAITSISAAMDRQNAKKDETTQDMLVSYGRMYLEEHRNGTCRCVSLNKLKETYHLDDKLFKKSDGSTFSGSISCDVNYTKFEFKLDSCGC